MRELHLFAGAGGGILGGILLGHTTVCAVEIEPYCRKVLLQRQRDGILPKFPIWDDVKTFDGKPWIGKVDIVCGGFPCQDICVASSAHGHREGINGKRSGLWSEMARIINEIRPQYALIENSGHLVSFGLASVLCDLAEMGYDAQWGVIGAHHVGAHHGRTRTWIVAYPCGKRVEGLRKGVNIGDTRPWGKISKKDLLSINPTERSPCICQPLLLRVDDGVADRMDRLKAIGNGQVPAVVELAWKVLQPG